MVCLQACIWVRYLLSRSTKSSRFGPGAASHLAEDAVGADASWYFHLHPWDYNQGQSYVDGWSQLGEKYPKIKTQSWFLAYEDGAFGSASFDASKGLFAGMGDFDGDSFTSAVAGGGDYTAVLETAKAANPDIFLWAGYDADALPIMEQAKAIGFAPPLFVGAPPGWPADFGKSSLAENVPLYGMWAPVAERHFQVEQDVFPGLCKEVRSRSGYLFCSAELLGDLHHRRSY